MTDQEKPWVAQALEALGDIHASRASVYGDDYLHCGEVLKGYFPRGLVLETAEDFNRFDLFIHCSTKLGRYAQSMARGNGGHIDSLDDLSVYAQLLQNHDRLAMIRKSEIKKAKPVRKGANKTTVVKGRRPVRKVK